VLNLPMLDLQVHGQQFGDGCAVVAAGLVRVLAANHHEADPALTHGGLHGFHLLRAKRGRGEVVEHNRVVVEQFFGSVGEAALAHARDGNRVRLQGACNRVACACPALRNQHMRLALHAGQRQPEIVARVAVGLRLQHGADALYARLVRPQGGRNQVRARREFDGDALDGRALTVKHDGALRVLLGLHHDAHDVRLADFGDAGRLQRFNQRVVARLARRQRHDINRDALYRSDLRGGVGVACRLVAVGQQHDAPRVAVGEQRARKAQRGGDVRAVGVRLGVHGVHRLARCGQPLHHRLRAEDDQPRPRVVGGLAEGLLQVLLCGGAPLVRDARRPIQHEHRADAAQRPDPLPPRQRQHNQQHQREPQRQNHPPTRPTDPQQTPTRPPDPAPRHRQQEQIPRLGETHGTVFIPDSGCPAVGYNTAVKRPKDTLTAQVNPVAERDRICTVLRQHLPDLQRRYPIRALWLFGSHARGEQRRRSDIDVLVEFRETPTLLDLARLQHELTQLLGKRVDLALKDALKPHIGKRILEEAIPL
jgi:predicted nucleotidyltransferase